MIGTNLMSKLGNLGGGGFKPAGSTGFEGPTTQRSTNY